MYFSYHLINRAPFEADVKQLRYLNCAGNLLNRTLGLLKKNCNSTLPVDSAVAAEGNAFKDSVEDLVYVYMNYFMKYFAATLIAEKPQISPMNILGSMAF